MGLFLAYVLGYQSVNTLFGHFPEGMVGGFQDIFGLSG